MSIRPSDDASRQCHSGSCDSVMWWAMLVIAVLAIPSLAILISLMVPDQNSLGQLLVFVFACWASVWVGMWLMKKSKFEALEKHDTPSQDE